MVGCGCFLVQTTRDSRELLRFTRFTAFRIVRGCFSMPFTCALLARCSSGFRQWLSEQLGEKRVQKVEVSRRLVDSPAALVQSAYGMSPTMARYMRAQAVAFGEVDSTMTGQQQVSAVVSLDGVALVLAARRYAFPLTSSIGFRSRCEASAWAVRCWV